MSYNREWDSGKDWNQGSWSHGSHAQGREGDDYYYGAEKRRKYNNYHDSQSSYYDHSGDSRRGYGQGQGDGYNDHGQDQSYEDRRGGGHKRRLVPSEPSPHVIFLGLDQDHTEGDLQAYLQSQNCSLDSVTIIRDRGTGLSKGFGFAQFTSVEHAKAFVQPNFPFISVPPPASHGASAAAAYRQLMAAGGQSQGRRVKIDFSQSANNSGDRKGQRFQSNDGTRDIGTSPSPLVLLRGIDAITTPAAAIVALRTAAGQGKDGTKGLRRILLIKDRTTGLGSGFAFLEFVDQASASTLLGCVMSPQLHPSGFRINDKPIAASFAHPFSFQLLAPEEIKDDACVPSSVHVGGNEGAWVRYWDENSTVAELAFDVEMPDTTEAAHTKKAKKKKEHKAPDDEVSAFLGSVSNEMHALPASDKPVTLSLNKTGLAPIKMNQPASGIKAPLVQMAFGAPEQSAPENTESADTVQGVDESKVAAGKKVAPLITSKKVASSINKWNSMQDELSGRTNSIVAAATSAAPVIDRTSDLNETTQSVVPVLTGHRDFEYADPKKMACFLCSRQFKTLEQLQRHNMESDLHKRNLQDQSLRELGRQKALNTTQDTGDTAPRYRDRAQERRVLHNQPDMPLPENGARVSKRKADAPPPPPPPAAPALAPAKDESNVGNKLLQKMGWSQGMGLGTEGDGRVDPIETAIYEQGVGLGASKGKDIGKLIEGYSGYVNMARDSARERFDESR